MTFRNKIGGASLFCLAASLGCLSCNSDVETYDSADDRDAVLTAFSLSDNDSVCYSLSSYLFTIDQWGSSDPDLSEAWQGAGIIFNADSLPLGSVADSVVVSLSYSSPTSVYFYQYDAAGQPLDTVNFANQTWLDLSECAYTRLVITAEDGETQRSYMLKVNVHTVEGDTIRWRQAARELWDASAWSEQRAVMSRGTLCWFSTEGDGVQRVRRNNTATPLSDLTLWSEATPLNSPAAVALHTIYEWNGVLYAVSADGSLLQSADEVQWSEVPTGLQFVNLLGVTYAGRTTAEKLHALVRDVNGTLRFASRPVGGGWTVGEEVPAGFPVQGYSRPETMAARVNLGSTMSRLYIVGGKTSEGELIASTWTCDGTQWAEFKQPYLPAMSGAAIVRYTLDTDYPDTFWLLAAGETADGVNNTLYYSENYGVTWRKLASDYEAYTDNSMLTPRAYTTGFCGEDYQFYFVGGTWADGSCAPEVVGGQLTKLTFLKNR